MKTEARQLKILVCRGPTCCLMGSSELLQWCRDLEEAGIGIRHEITSCTGNCSESPVVQWQDHYITEASPEKLTEALLSEACL